jgi:hypothetical protein
VGVYNSKRFIAKLGTVKRRVLQTALACHQLTAFQNFCLLKDVPMIDRKISLKVTAPYQFTLALNF